MEDNKVFRVLSRIISLAITIIPIIMFFVFLKPIYTILVNGPVYFDINYVLLISIEIINIAITVFLFTRKEKIKKIHVLIITLLIIISTLIPVYHVKDAKLPTGPKAYLMGTSVINLYKDIYGIDISALINTFK